MLSNWRNRPRPTEKLVEQRGRITGPTGKSTACETVTARSVVAMKWGNAHGAEGPSCTSTLFNKYHVPYPTGYFLHLVRLTLSVHIFVKAPLAFELNR